MNINLLVERLIEDCQLKKDSPIVVGFSGGPDSSTLLHSLNEMGYAVLAAHADHALRPESAAEARRTEDFAQSYGIPFFSERLEVNTYASEAKLSLEEAARDLRYRFLFRVAGEHGAQAVAVAHNADDQVETVLMHLLRGAGSAGLRGMQLRLSPNPWSSKIPLVRPLLRVWRKEIEEYCLNKGLEPVLDASNMDQSFFRNRLRLEALPYLETLAPKIKHRLYQTAVLAMDEHSLIDGLLEQAWKRILVQRGPGFLAFSRRNFAAQPISLQRGILRRAIADLRSGERDIDFAAVQRGLDFIESPASSVERDWIAATTLLIEDDVIWAAAREATLPHLWPQAPSHLIHLEVPSEIDLNEPWRIAIREVAAPQIAIKNADPYQAWLAAEQAGDELVLRRRKPGDRFQPLGMQQGSAKVSDFMINQKVPRRARDAWPLLCKGDEIIWIPGYQIANAYRLRASTRAALHVQLSQGGAG